MSGVCGGMSTKEFRPLGDLAHLLPGGVDVLSLEGVQTPAGLFSRDFRILWMNNAMGLVHRCKPKNAVGGLCHEMFKNCGIPCGDCCMTAVATTGRMVVSETWIDLPGGERRWGDLHAYPVRGDGGDIEAIFVLAFDTTHHVMKVTQAESECEPLLSPRETEVLRLMAEGHTNTQISGILDISTHTVKSHVNGVFNKLGVNDRTLAAVQAVRRNLI